MSAGGHNKHRDRGGESFTSDRSQCFARDRFWSSSPCPPVVRLDAIEEHRTDNPDAELQRLHAALTRSIQEIDALKERVQERLPEIDRAIFDVHRMMLEDVAFIEKIETQIQDGYAADTALKKVTEGYVETLERTDGGHLRDRAADVRDIGQRVLRHLLGLEEKSGPQEGESDSCGGRSLSV